MDRFSELNSTALKEFVWFSLLSTLADTHLYCETEERLKQRSRKIELKLWVNLVFELCMPSAPPRLLSFLTGDMRLVAMIKIKVNKNSRDMATLFDFCSLSRPEVNGNSARSLKNTSRCLIYARQS